MSKEETDEASGKTDGFRRRGVVGSSIRWLLGPLALLGLVLIWRSLPISDWVEQGVLPRIEQAGWRGYLVFSAVYVSAVVLMAPGTILTLTGGYLFGPILGTTLALGSAVTGASIAFLIARRIAREAVRRRVEADHRFQAIDRTVAQRGAWVVLLLRLSPIVPFNVLNYALGLTGVRLSTYILTSLVGMVPGTAAIAFIGASASDRRLVDLGWGWWAFLLSLTLLTTTGLALLANRALVRAGAGTEPDPPDDFNKTP